jgi:CheY-like chemotaxis protein
LESPDSKRRIFHVDDDADMVATLDGYQLCRVFRAHPGFKEVCIVAVSAYGNEADRQKSRQAGFDAHVRKPLDLPVLNSILTQFRKSLERRAGPR